MTNAYAAGLIDGEGCLSILARKKKTGKPVYYVRVDVAMTEKALSVLEFLKANWGGNIRIFREQTEKWGRAYAWHLMGAETRPMLEAIQPYLKLKQEQARLCLSLHSLMERLPRTYGNRAAWTLEARSKGKTLQMLISELNQKGPTNAPMPGWFARVVGDHTLTPQADLLSDLGYKEFSGTWPDSAMFQDGFVYELQSSAPPILENESSSWRTPCNRDHHPNAIGNRSDKNIAQVQLAHQVDNWPTARREDGESCGNHPGATDSLTGATRNWLTPHGMHGTDHTGKTGRGGEFAAQATQWQTPATDSFPSRGGDRKDEMGLDQQARFFPTQRDYRTPNKRSYQERGGATKGEQLQNFVEHSLPVPQTNDGPTSCEKDPTSRRRLNPQFVEWLMGFPPGWTEL